MFKCCEHADPAKRAIMLVLGWRRRSGRASKRPAVAPTSRRGSTANRFYSGRTGRAPV